MEQEEKIRYSTTTAPVKVRMYTQVKEVEKRLLRGRVLLDSDEKTMLFAQNEPRTKFSKEIFRSDHGRLVRRWDGFYTFTLSKLDASERRLRESLLSELRNASDAIARDVKRQEAKVKRALAEAEKDKKGGEE